MSSKTLEPPLRFTAHVLVKNPGPGVIPRARHHDGVQRLDLCFDIYYQLGPPSSKYGLPSDLYFDGNRRVFYRDRSAWALWDGYPGTQWPHDPDHPVEATSTHVLVFKEGRGLFWGGKTLQDRVIREGGSRARVKASRAIAQTIKYWGEQFAKGNDQESSDVGDYQRISQRLDKAKFVDTAADVQRGGSEADDGDDRAEAQAPAGKDGKHARQDDTGDEPSACLALRPMTLLTPWQMLYVLLNLVAHTRRPRAASPKHPFLTRRRTLLSPNRPPSLTSRPSPCQWPLPPNPRVFARQKLCPPALSESLCPRPPLAAGALLLRLRCLPCRAARPLCLQPSAILRRRKK